MAIHRQHNRNRAGMAQRPAGMETHLLSACVLALTALGVLLTFAA